MDFRTQLKSSNLSVTPVRLAIHESLVQKSHIEASQIFQIVQEKIQTTSIQAIYKNLNILVKHGLIREIKPKGMASLYEMRVGDNHHHLICRACDTILDTDCLDTAPCLTSTNPRGFVIDEAEIIFWGLCPKCQSSNKGDSL
ncbi:Fur family transcriptional regulator [Candidatus Haliotispira prima]|uniref:Fur family transcriptional regulator n=1 Tax=Candidatus Haliotispira prima TaxID=3034016 RepID=UPI0038995C6A